MTTMIDRPKERGPANGYDFAEKQDYREAVWRAFAENVIDVSSAKVLFFPGRLGLEIPVALRHGFKEENLIACDENAALIATAEWHKQYPRIKCYGSILVRAIERMKADKVRIDAANLDFCSNLCSSFYDNLQCLCDWPVLSDACLLAVTLLKGRESEALVDTVRATMQTEGAIDRIGVARLYLAKIGICTWGIVKGEYRSGTKNMVWAIWKLRSQQQLSRQWSDFVHTQRHLVDKINNLHALTVSSVGKSTPKVLVYHDEAIDIARDLAGNCLLFKDAIKGWCVVDHFQDSIEGWWELCSALAWLWDYVPHDVVELRQRLIRSEAEKAQILCDRGQWS